MSCKPCQKKKNKKMNSLPYITCNCGTNRLLDKNLTAGTEVKLPPCPKCGSSFHGVVTKEGFLQEMLPFEGGN